MRNDVKIGIAVGVVVIVIGLIWFVFLPNKPGEEEAPATTEEPLPGYGMESPEEPTGETAVEQPAEPPQDESTTELTVLDESTVEVSVIVDVQPSPSDNAQGGVIDVAGSEGVSELAEAAPVSELPRHDPEAGPALTSSPLAGTGRTGRWGRRPPSDTAGEQQPSDLATMPATAGGGHIGGAVGPAGDRTPSTGAATTYTVVAGDSFWRIAEQLYGDGSKYPLIRDANPSVDPNVLRPGMRLVIPPAPAPQPPSTLASESATGEQQLPAGAPAGSTTYVVQQNDSYWKIALAEYGNGLYHYVLQEANGIAAGSLRPGMVLIIPPKPAPAADTGATGTATGPAEIIAGPGQTIYTVVAGDSFWRIAKNEYGAGHLWPVIREANPQVNPRRLQAGQKLILPSIEDARRAVGEDPSGERGGERSGTTRPSDDNRPVFD